MLRAAVANGGRLRSKLACVRSSACIKDGGARRCARCAGAVHRRHSLHGGHAHAATHTSNTQCKTTTNNTQQSGDRVVYSKYAGTELAVAGDEHVLLKEDDVIGVLPAGDDISKMTPLGDRVLIKCAAAEGKTAGGVLLTAEADKPTLGSVVAVGGGKKDEDGKAVAPNVTVGATVMYSKYSGTEFEEGDDSFIVVRESDILAQLD